MLHYALSGLCKCLRNKISVSGKRHLSVCCQLRSPAVFEQRSSVNIGVSRKLILPFEYWIHEHDVWKAEEVVGHDMLGLKHWSLMLWQLQNAQLPCGERAIVCSLRESWGGRFLKLCASLRRRALKVAFKIYFFFLQIISRNISVSLRSVAWNSWKYSICS